MTWAQYGAHQSWAACITHIDVPHELGGWIYRHDSGLTT